jgi:hypothetical protein
VRDVLVGVEADRGIAERDKVPVGREILAVPSAVASGIYEERTLGSAGAAGKMQAQRMIVEDDRLIRDRRSIRDRRAARSHGWARAQGTPAD